MHTLQPEKMIEDSDWRTEAAVAKAPKADQCQERTLAELITARAASDPSRSAAHERDAHGIWRATTAGELLNQAKAVAASFLARGLVHGDRVAIIAATSQRWLVAEAAAYLIGAVVVGVDRSASFTEISGILSTNGIGALVIDDATVLESLPPSVHQRLKTIIVLNGPALGVIAWAEAIGTEPAGDLPEIHPDHEALIVHTSGTTGRARAIVYSHRQVLAALRTLIEEYALPVEAGDAILAWLPMSALFQRMMNWFAWYRGVAIHFLSDPRLLLEAMREVRPTHFVGVPRFFEKVFEQTVRSLPQHPRWLRRFLENGVREPPKRGTWAHALLAHLVHRPLRRALGGRLRVVVSGSAAMPDWLLSTFASAGITILEAYGLSENIVPLAANRPENHRLGSVGRPFATTALRFSTEGEIQIRGPGVFSQYLGEPADERRFTADGFYRTGDIGHQDADGFLYLTGRLNDLIKTSTGRRVAPEAIEAVYRQSPYVDQIVVVGEGRKHLAALITLSQAGRIAQTLTFGDRCAMRSLIASDLDRVGVDLAAHERIGTFTILEQAFAVETGELTMTGKLRRQAIAQRHQAAIERMYADADGCARRVPA